ncbi:conserved protein of unknown function [Candidatus Hydrogenisulfobacillus filiaventi]|uniref:UPF0173 metal-dependent hydrolase R50_2296 n=1 Tax=Candidatus Hydrogenisulfobacillus filiaventi TaxID=2707344 RepID=A0A6F8ZK11_9FIRM|nr:metal-dependent hydrolase [Bacillota bacterium]CAB1129793.1 conserved protein of unknown function [Candidatus Hydrogenisulfobacillus filiaventi]
MGLNGATLTWLGHATVLVTTAGGKRIIIDPWLEGNPKCPAAYHHLDQVDAILITHGHFDHMGSAAALARRTGAVVVANFEIASYLEGEGVRNTVGMNKGGTVEVPGARVTMVYADHSSGISTPDGLIYGGEASGLVLVLDNGVTVYHAGDTNVFGDMALIRDLYAPEVACLPIGGHFTMAPREAAYAVGLLEPALKVVIPIHYGTFPALTGTPAALAELLAGQAVEVRALAPGESYR